MQKQENIHKNTLYKFYREEKYIEEILISSVDKEFILSKIILCYMIFDNIGNPLIY